MDQLAGVIDAWHELDDDERAAILLVVRRRAARWSDHAQRAADRSRDRTVVERSIARQGIKSKLVDGAGPCPDSAEAYESERAGGASRQPSDGGELQ